MHPDAAVGAVSAIAGLLLAGAAAANHPYLFALPRAAWLSERLGRPTARALLAAAGLAFAVLGGWLVWGTVRP